MAENRSKTVVTIPGMSCTVSSGIKKLPSFKGFFPESDGVKLASSRRLARCHQVIGWGNKPNTEAARGLASSAGRPFVAMEDGFYRSIRPGFKGDPPLSLIVDDLGVYYDATRPSRLERLLQDGEAFSPELLNHAESLIRFIRAHRLSKYNHAPDLDSDLPGNHHRKVLVVDQTFGDCSVTFGAASGASFQEMLSAACREHPDADILVKTHPDVLAGKVRGYLDSAMCRDPRVFLIDRDISPLSLLEAVDAVYVVTSQMGFEALLCDKPVVCFGVPFYSGWGLTDDRVACPRRTMRRNAVELFAAACLLYPRYINPQTGEPGRLGDVLRHLARYRTAIRRLPREEAVCVNFYWWKRRFLRKLVAPMGLRLSFSDASYLATSNRVAMVWGGTYRINDQGQSGQPYDDVIAMEDGFVRSNGLGSDYTPPCSLVIDRAGIYFDPRQASDLENFLEHGEILSDELLRARRLRERVLAEQISKYGVGEHAPLILNALTGQKVVLVVGQVENDASIQVGAIDVRTNMALLAAVRKSCPDSYIVFKPHPDVVSGNRPGQVSRGDALRFCDHIETDRSITRCLEVCDEVHTITSLSGFEALLRGVRVVTYGLPFYAGWGLTVDRHRCARRTRKLTIDELVYGVLIWYPIYLDPATKQLISVEAVLDLLAQQRDRGRHLRNMPRPLKKLLGLWQWIR